MMKSPISKRSIVVLLIVLVAFLSSVSAQQGWSRVQTIRHKGSDATVSAVWYDGRSLWVVGADGLIVQSVDDGSTVTAVDLGISEGLNDVVGRGRYLWIVGDKGTILLSTDSGRSFVKSLYRPSQTGQRGAPGGGAPVDLYSVQFTDDRRGYVVGDQGLILATTDGGRSWDERTSGTDAQLFHLFFQSGYGWAVGTGGVIVHTIDGGRSWYPQRSGVTSDLNRVCFIDDRRGMITGNDGVLLRTENAGATWEQVPLRVKSALFGISFVDKKTGWVVGYDGNVIRTFDGGRHWIEQFSATANDLFAVSFFRNKGFAIGREGVLVRYYENR